VPADHVAARESLDRGDRRAAYTLIALVFATYFATSSAHLAGGDNAEFVTIFATGGVAHPSGYPLYCILLHLFDWMPGGPVLGSSRVTALIGTVSVAALYRACRAWRASPSASLVASASYALDAAAWRLATEAEVFALNALFVALLLWAAAPGVMLAPAKRVILLAGLAGLALSNQMTIVLMAPVGLLAAIRALLASRSRVRVGLSAAGAFGAGLLPYLYCYSVGHAPKGRYVWGEPGTWGGLVRHVTRADFETLSMTASSESADWPSKVRVFFEQTAGEALVVPVLVGLLGSIQAYRRAPTTENADGASPVIRRHLIALLASWVLSGPVFAALLGLAPDALGATLWERFHLQPAVVFAVAVAWGLDEWRALRDGRAVPLVVAGIAIVAAGAIHSWPEVRDGHTDALELYTENTEKSAPPGAVILGTGDYRLFSFAYANAIHLRSDVTYIDPHLLGYDWYRKRAGGDLGASIAMPQEQTSDDAALVDQVFSLGRPVLLTDVFDAQLAKVFPSYPFGTLIRLLPRGAPLPAPESVENENLSVFAAFRRWDLTPRDDEWARAVLPTYQRPWVALARIFERRGDEARAKANRLRAEEWSGQNAGDSPL
jgi:hypothetical protein